MRNSITFKLWGDNAIFTDPITKIGGELCTYQVPTYEALKGIVGAIYWKPTIVWYIDRVKVVNQIRTESKNIKLMENDFASKLCRYTYLNKVEYIVEAHFEWDLTREDLAQDRDENKHHNIAKRYLKKGGKRDIFLGKRECVGFVEPCADFDSVESFYKDNDAMSFGIMFHSFIYPSEKDEHLYANLDSIVMRNGVIEFKRPEDCELKREVNDMQFKRVETGLDACDEEVLKEVSESEFMESTD